MSYNLQSSYSKVSLMYSQIKNENFSPGYADRFLPKKRSLLEDYLAEKERSPKKLEFTKILSSSPTHRKVLQNTPSFFTFEGISEDCFSQLLAKNKRKFGKKWELSAEDMEKDKHLLSPHYLSADVTPRYATSFKKNVTPTKSPQGSFKKFEVERESFIKKQVGFKIDIKEIKLPSIKVQAPKIDPPKHRKFHSVGRDFEEKLRLLPEDQKEALKLRTFINNLIEKNLGLKAKPGEDKRFKKKPKEIETESSVCENESKDVVNSLELLSSGYMSYSKNVSNTLRVEKMVTAHHKFERKLTLITFPPLKKHKGVL